MRKEPTWRIPAGLLLLLAGLMVYAGLVARYVAPWMAGWPALGQVPICPAGRGVAALAALSDLDGDRALGLMAPRHEFAHRADDRRKKARSTWDRAF
jgi:hypothetical protein